MFTGPEAVCWRTLLRFVGCNSLRALGLTYCNSQSIVSAGSTSVFTQAQEARTCRVPSQHTRSCIYYIFIYCPTHIFTVWLRRRVECTLFLKRRRPTTCLAGFFLSLQRALDWSTHNARRELYIITCARLVGESGMLLFVLVINGGRQKPVNLGKEHQFGSFVFAESPLNNERRNKGAHGDGKSLLLWRERKTNRDGKCGVDSL